MNITEAGELKTFEASPYEVTLWVAAVRYGGAHWCIGPYGRDKNAVLQQLGHWTAISDSRIYSIKLPVVAGGEGPAK